MQLRGRYLGSLVLVAGLLIAGCGQEIKKENEQLKGQITNIQKENADLKAEIVVLKGENEAITKELDEVKEKFDQLEQQVKSAKMSKPAKKK
jgi:predicted transcriptional regulator